MLLRFPSSPSQPPHLAILACLTLGLCACADETSSLEAQNPREGDDGLDMASPKDSGLQGEDASGLDMARLPKKDGGAELQDMKGKGGVDLAAELDMQERQQDAGPSDDMTMASPAKDHLIVVVTPHGFIPEDLLPTSSPSGLKLPPTLAPFESVKDKILALQGLEYDPRWRDRCSSITHWCPALVLTGSLRDLSVEGEPPSPGGGTRWLPDRASADVLINQSFSPPLPSFILAAKVLPSTSLFRNTSLSYDTKGEPIEALRDPLKVIDTLKPLAPAGAGDPLYQRVLALEKKYQKDPVDPSQLTQTETFARVLPDLMELMGIARAWEVSRAMVFQLDSTFSGAPYSNLGLQAGVNRLAHDTGGPNSTSASALTGQGQYKTVQRYWGKQIAELAKALATQKTADGSSLLDHTVILWISDTGWPGTHSSEDISAVMIGNLSGKLKQGEVVTSDQKVMDLLYTLGQVMGASEIKKLGNPKNPPKLLKAILK